jgi:FADH2 O2-dependent halogenase
MSSNFDVAILGTGFSGSILGAILFRHGHRVLLIDEKEHPKLAVGEATIPQTTMMMRAIADRYDVPEIGACSTFEGMHEHVTSHCGIKSNFGFIYQREGLPQNPQEVTQNIIPHLLVGYDSHWYRQNVEFFGRRLDEKCAPITWPDQRAIESPRPKRVYPPNARYTNDPKYHPSMYL